MVSRNDLKNMLVVCQVKGNFEKQTGALSKQTFGLANRYRNQPLRKRFNLFKSDRMIEGINFGNWLIVEWQFMVNDIWFCHYSMESTAFIPVSGLCAAACKTECHKSWMKQFSCYPWRRHVNHFPSAVWWESEETQRQDTHPVLRSSVSETYCQPTGIRIVVATTRTAVVCGEAGFVPLRGWVLDSGASSR